MDALEFLKERRRMCLSYVACKGCPLERGTCVLSVGTSDEICERVIAAVEQWSKEHPRKTRQSVFLEQYPEAELTKDGVVSICPIAVSAAYRDADGGCAVNDRKCAVCCRKFWMQEIE